MVNIFISGAKHTNHLPKGVIQSIYNIIRQHDQIIVGDMPFGTDKLVIELVADYQHTVVYGTRQQPRTPLSNYTAYQRISTTVYHDQKKQQLLLDKAMIKEADYAILILDPVTVSQYNYVTVDIDRLRNAIQLLTENKPIRCFYKLNDEMAVTCLKTIKDLDKLIRSYKYEHIKPQLGRRLLNARNAGCYNDPTDVKYHHLVKNYLKLKRAFRKK